MAGVIMAQSLTHDAMTLPADWREYPGRLLVGLAVLEANADL